jgi:hypothetical protein
MAPVTPPPRATQLAPPAQDAAADAPAPAKTGDAGLFRPPNQLSPLPREQVRTPPELDPSFEKANFLVRTYYVAQSELDALDNAQAPAAVRDRKADEVNTLRKDAIAAADENLKMQKKTAGEAPDPSTRRRILMAESLVGQANGTPKGKAVAAWNMVLTETFALEIAAGVLRDAKISGADPKAAQQRVDRAAAHVMDVARKNTGAIQAGLEAARKDRKDIAYCEDLVRNVGSWQDINHDGQRRPRPRLNLGLSTK